MCDDYSLDIDKFELLDSIGSGQYGIAFKTREKNKGNIYAAKISRKVFTKEADQMSMIKDLFREVTIICKLDHRSIIQFIGFSPKDFHHNPKPVIITEYAGNGSLRTFLEAEIKGLSDHKWNDTQKLIILYGIASAMSYLHSHNIIHRDLKPENILMDENLYPKIGDFGLSKVMHFNEDSLSAASQSGFKGTFLYSAPETLIDNEYSPASDVYSFGMFAFELFTSQIPFEKYSLFQLIQKVSSGVRPEFKCTLPDSYVNLIETCWAQDPNDRPSFDQIVIDLKTDEGFITETVDEVEFLNFVDYIDDYDVSFKSDSSVSSLDELLENDFYEKISSFNTKKSLRIYGIKCNKTEEELIKFFSKFGEVTKLFFVKPKRGVCFVEFKNEQSCSNVIADKENLYFEGRKLHVHLMQPNDMIVLTMLPQGTTINDVAKVFAGFKIVKIKITKNWNAFVRFESEEIREKISKKHFVSINGAYLPLLISISRRMRMPKRNKRKIKI